MPYWPELAEPLFSVRDVVESFRSYGVTVPDWHSSLRTVAAALEELAPRTRRDLGLPPLVADINRLLTTGLAGNADLAAAVAASTAENVSPSRRGARVTWAR